MRGMISRRILRWKSEMHMTFENRLYIRSTVDTLASFPHIHDIPGVIGRLHNA